MVLAWTSRDADQLTEMNRERRPVKTAHLLEKVRFSRGIITKEEDEEEEEVVEDKRGRVRGASMIIAREKVGEREKGLGDREVEDGRLWRLQRDETKEERRAMLEDKSRLTSRVRAAFNSCAWDAHRRRRRRSTDTRYALFQPV
ncbi:hypothetical protein M0802_008108 [Mischocyttarus mexicanus]|nr:hypothetical protein M0802_008108 [Mischocyttarus mexicanus]